MMKPKLYVETSIPSALTARPSREPSVAALQQWTVAWWDRHRHDFDLFVSAFVVEEISLGDSVAAGLRKDAIKGLPMLDTTKTMRRMARKLIRELHLPISARIDASHLAISIEGGMDYLLTWNCRHIANPMHQARIREMARRRNLNAPIICTPYDLLRGASDASQSDS